MRIPGPTSLAAGYSTKYYRFSIQTKPERSTVYCTSVLCSSCNYLWSCVSAVATGALTDVNDVPAVDADVAVVLAAVDNIPAVRGV